MFVLKKRKYTWLDMYRIPFSCAPVSTVLVTVQKALTALANVFQVIVVAEFLDGTIEAVVNGSFDRSIILWFVLMLLMVSWKRVSYNIGRLFNSHFVTMGNRQILQEFTKKRTRLEYYLLEDPATEELTNRVVNRLDQNLEQLLQRFVNLFVIYIPRIVGVLLIIAFHVWWLAIVVMVMAVPLVFISLRGGQKIYRANEEAAVYERRHKYLFEVLTGRETTEERSLFGYSGPVNAQWYHQYDTARKINMKAEAIFTVNMQGGSIITSILASAVSLIMIPLTVSGALSVGLFISLSTAIYDLVRLMGWEMTSGVAQIARYREYMKDLTAFAALPERQGTSAEVGTSTEPAGSAEADQSGGQAVAGGTGEQKKKTVREAEKQERGMAAREAEERKRGKPVLEAEERKRGKTVLEAEERKRGKTVLEAEERKRGKAVQEAEERKRGKTLLEAEERKRGMAVLEAEEQMCGKIRERTSIQQGIPRLQTLEFRHVTFRYPGTKTDILKDFSMELREGVHYAIVGENGAGKSTLIKLLTGLYRDYEGEILYNGVEMRTFPQEQWFRVFSCVFQDFARYYLSVEENICLGAGDMEFEPDEAGERTGEGDMRKAAESGEAGGKTGEGDMRKAAESGEAGGKTGEGDMRKAAESGEAGEKNEEGGRIGGKTAEDSMKTRMREVTAQLGLKEAVEALKYGYRTRLGKLDEDSVDLSGGQWQRVAMARALMNDAPMLLLDEPTAALDPISESELYEKFGEISRNHTTIFISHRLGSTRLSDHIFVLKDGCVREQGSHDELMSMGGIYAAMYETQQSWYIKEKK